MTEEELKKVPFRCVCHLALANEHMMTYVSKDGTHIMVKTRPDDSSWQCFIKDDNGNPIDYVERILERLPEKYRDHLVTLKHDAWISYSYVPVFDTDTQAIWDKELDTFYKAKQEWCDKYGCD